MSVRFLQFLTPPSQSAGVLIDPTACPWTFGDFLPPRIPVLNRGGKKSLFDIKLRLLPRPLPDFLPPPRIPNYTEIILGGKVGG